MSEVAIFLYGLVVFSIVSAACMLIVWGIVQERRDREQLDAGPDAHPVSDPVSDVNRAADSGGQAEASGPGDAVR
jgi:hypothetical protein